MLEVRKMLRATSFLGDTNLLASKASKNKNPHTNLAESKKSVHKFPKSNIYLSGTNKKKRRFSTTSWSPAVLENPDQSTSFKPRTPKMLINSNISKSAELRQKTISKKDQNAMKLLFFLSIEFFFTNIPMAVVKIAMSFGYSDEAIFEEFVVLSIVLEVSFAASNFYLYCLCNSQIRRKVYYLS